MNKIKVNVEAKMTVPLDSLIPFQGNLKHIEKTEYEKLRKVLIEQGFSFAVHIWQNKGKNYIIDGHQRVFVLKQMAETEGFEVPDLPVSVIKAKTFKEAKLRVLAGASQYGKFDDAGVREFLKENDLAIEDVMASFDFATVDLSSLVDINGSTYVLDGDNSPPPEAPSKGSPESSAMPSSSINVKQVQLYFEANDHSEFMEKTELLAEKFGTENITDTVMRCVRESYKARD